MMFSIFSPLLMTMSREHDDNVATANLSSVITMSPLVLLWLEQCSTMSLLEHCKHNATSTMPPPPSLKPHAPRLAGESSEHVHGRHFNFLLSFEIDVLTQRAFRQRDLIKKVVKGDLLYMAPSQKLDPTILESETHLK